MQRTNTLKNLHFVLPILLLFLSASVLAQLNPKVLIIGIDGCRSDALQQANTPNIDALINNATYSYEALTEAQTWSGVGWSGMLTGVWKDKHGVSDNSFNGANYGNYPHFFNHLATCAPSLQTASIVHWGPINSQIVDQIDFALTVSTDLAVQQEAVDYLGTNDPDVLFLHFDDVDGAGHGNGFSPTVGPYIASIEQTDTYVGQIVTALENRPDYANEDWLIIVSTDHGGNANGHGGASIEERTIFAIFSGDAFSNEQRSKTTNIYNIDHALSLNGLDNYVDIPSNAAYQFGSNQDFTIECRIRVDALSGDPVMVSNKNWVSGLNPGYVFSFPANGPQWKVNIGDGVNRVDINGGAINDGEWHHLAVSFDRDGLMKLYQDGSLVEAKNISSIGNIDTAWPLTIGQDGPHNYGDWMDGEIAEVRLWNTVVEEADLISYACGSVDNSHPNAADLIGYWPLNIGSGTIAKDASSNNNNGTIQGTGPTWLTGAGALLCNDYSSTFRVVDVAATALNYLCVSLDPVWDLDGEALDFNAPLPVELISFVGQAKEEVNELIWKGLNEENLKAYIVERINDNGQFKAIGNTPATAKSGEIKSYKFVDQNPLRESYYRLQMLDEDGAYSFSKIVHVARANKVFNVIHFSPVPVRHQLLLNYELGRKQMIHFSLYNVSGQLLDSREISGEVGEHQINLDFSKYISGPYIVVLKSGSDTWQQKIVKQ